MITQGVGATIGAGTVALLLLTCIALSASATGSVLSPPYGGFVAHVNHNSYIVGCSSTAVAKKLVRPSFVAATGEVRLGSNASTGCNRLSSSAQAEENVAVVGPNFTVASNGSYWVNASWNNTFTLDFQDTCARGCTSSSYAHSSYDIQINVTIRDVTTNQTMMDCFSKNRCTYLNSTTAAGSTSKITYRNVLLAFDSKLNFSKTDVYRFRITVSEGAFAWVSGIGARASTILDIGSMTNGAWIKNLSVS
jgi:hypothetical protein